MIYPKTESGLVFLLGIGLILFGIGTENVNGLLENDDLETGGQKSGDTKSGKLDVASRTLITFFQLFFTTYS